MAAPRDPEPELSDEERAILEHQVARYMASDERRLSFMDAMAFNARHDALVNLLAPSLSDPAKRRAAATYIAEMLPRERQ